MLAKNTSEVLTLSCVIALLQATSLCAIAKQVEDNHDSDHHGATLTVTSNDQLTTRDSSKHELIAQALNRPAAAKSGTATTSNLSSDKPAENTPTESTETLAPSDTQKVPVPAPAAAREMTPTQLTEYRQAKAATHFDLAQVYFRNWNLNLADVEYEVTLLYTPDLKIARRDLCLVSLFRGHPLKALAQLMVLVGLADPVPFTEAEAAALNARAAKLHYEQALNFAKAGDWVNAIAECQWALIYQPNNASYRHSLAFAFANQGNFENAEKEYSSVFALDPADGFARADFALMLESAGNKTKALSELSKAVELEPSAAALHVDLGWLAEAKGNLPLAEEEFQKAVTLSPKHATLWIHLGKIYEKESKNDQATDAYTKAISLDPSLSDIKERLTKLKS
jgi:Flp pilus assembly protein TadD